MGFYGFHVHVGKYYISVPWNLSWVLRNKQHRKTSVSMYSQASMSCYCKWQIVKITKFQNKHSFLHRSFCWNPYIPGTHIMTLVLIGKDLILNVLRSKIEDKKIPSYKTYMMRPQIHSLKFCEHKHRPISGIVCRFKAPRKIEVSICASVWQPEVLCHASANHVTCVIFRLFVETNSIKREEFVFSSNRYDVSASKN